MPSFCRRLPMEVRSSPSCATSWHLQLSGMVRTCSSFCSQCVSVTGALHAVPVQVTLVDGTAIVAHSRLLCGNVTATSLLQRAAHVACRHSCAQQR